jgi:hypothetical protein
VESDVESGDPCVAPIKRPTVKSARIAACLTVAVELAQEGAARPVAKFVGP